MSSFPYYNAGGGAPVIVQGQEVNTHSHGSGGGGGRFTQANVYNLSPSHPTDHKAQGQPRQCRDAFWAVLFYAHLAVMGYLAVVYAPDAIDEMAENQADGGGGGGGGRRRLMDLMPSSRFLQDNDNNNYNGDQELDIDINAVLMIMCLSGIVGLILSTLALGFMMSFAETLIRMALIFNIFMFALMAAASLLGGSLLTTIMFVLMTGFAAYYAYAVWGRIPFAASNLVTAVTAVRANMGLAFYAYLSLILLFGWSIWWAISAISTIYVINQCDADGECGENPMTGVVTFLLVLSYYWTIQVISNVVVVTTAGVVGTWWHTPHMAAGCCSKAVRDSYVRSITTSFGSICFGSLIVAIIQATKEMIHSMREQGDSFIACCAECLIGCLESLVEYFNKWAYVYVGLYGFSFIEAGSSVMELFRSRGWTSIITDYMVDTVLSMLSVGVGLLTAILAVILGAISQMASASTLGIAFVMGFVVGFGLCATLFSVVSSATNTVIVCYAEAPNEFQANHAELSNRMRSTWRQAWPNEFRY